MSGHGSKRLSLLPLGRASVVTPTRSARQQAWRMLDESVVAYRSQPVGAVAAEAQRLEARTE